MVVGGVGCEDCGWAVQGIEAQTKAKLEAVLQSVFLAHRGTGRRESGCSSSWDTVTIFQGKEATREALKYRAKGKKFGRLMLIRGGKS
jgi:hypothetical protein